MSELNLPVLYRQILRAAQKFPSIKRDSIVQEIKAEFAANKVRVHGTQRFNHAHGHAKTLEQCCPVRCCASCPCCGQTLCQENPSASRQAPMTARSHLARLAEYVSFACTLSRISCCLLKVGFVLQALTGEKEVAEKRQLAVSSLRQLEEYIGISHDESSAQSQIFLRGPANSS